MGDGSRRERVIGGPGCGYQESRGKKTTDHGPGFAGGYAAIGGDFSGWFWGFVVY